MLEVEKSVCRIVNASYRKGFYEFGDELLFWLNSLDSSEFTVKDFRSALNLKVLDMQPKIEYIIENGRTTATRSKEHKLPA